MARLLALAAALLLSSAASAAVAPSFEAFGPAVNAALKQVKAAAPLWSSVNMTVNAGPGYSVISDYGLRINLTGAVNGGGAYFSGQAGEGFASVSANSFGRGWSLFGSGVSVTMNSFGDGYTVWGSVDGRNVSYSINRFGSGLSVFGQSGANLSVSGWGTNLSAYGQIDETRFNRKALAVLGATLALAAR